MRGGQPENPGTARKVKPGARAQEGSDERMLDSALLVRPIQVRS
jgi:hypothetical protein